MSKFKDGDIVFSPHSGFNKIIVDNSPLYPVKHGKFYYTSEGKMNSQDKYPMLLTLDEAAKLGYYPPKKKIKVTYYTGFNKVERNHGVSLDGVLTPSLDVANELFKNYDGIATVIVEVEE